MYDSFVKVFRCQTFSLLKLVGCFIRENPGLYTNVGTPLIVKLHNMFNSKLFIDQNFL